MQHLLKMLDLSGEEILNLLNMADQLKYEQKHHIPHPHLKGQSLGMIFQNPRPVPAFPLRSACISSAARRCFFKQQRSANRPRRARAGYRARSVPLSDGIMIRTYAQQEVEDLAQYGSIPIINGLTDFAIPARSWPI